jgi:hypothetical protein
MRHLTLAALLSLSVALPAAAQTTTALVLGTEDYDNVGDVRRGDEVADAAEALDDAGVRVLAETGATVDKIAEALAGFGQTARQSDRLLIVLAGRFVHSATETYYLPSDIDPQPLATLSREALPLSTVLAYLASTPGHAVLALASDDSTGTFGPLVSYGFGGIEAPQGVTIATGEPRQMARFIRDTLARPGRAMGDGARAAGVTLSGFVARDQVFLPEPPPAEDAPAQTSDEDARQQDLVAWRAADRANTVEAYEDYIANQPDGQFRRMPEGRIAAL